MEGKQFQRTEDGHLLLMTPEEQNLLITDLAARINYGTICLIERVDDFGPIHRNEKLTGFCYDDICGFHFDFGGLDVDFVEKVKPYLRPLSSMTEEEQEEYDKWHEELEEGRIKDWKYAEYNDWLNAHHFDYRGLIEKGLALEAPKDMYKTE